MSTPIVPAVCAGCGTELAPRLLACPSCRRLVHSETLKEIVERAGAAHDAGDPTGALVEWRRALELLPAGSAQHAAVAERIAALGRQVDAARASPKGGPEQAAPGATSPLEARAAGVATGRRADAASPDAKQRGPLGAALAAILAVLAKGKMAILLLLSKGKLLLLGLTKLGTLSSMLLSFGLYATMWGWRFAAGLLISIYVHEMGHVAALQRYGIRATAPMFIPGFGAYIRAQQAMTDPRQDARVGLAGPLWGLAAAIVAYAIFRFTGLPIWGAIAGTGAWINLFNLLPVWQLDGSRGLRSLSRPERWIVAACAAAAFALTREGLLGIVAVLVLVRAIARNSEETSDPAGTALFCWLLATLALLVQLTHGGGAGVGGGQLR